MTEKMSRNILLPRLQYSYDANVLLDALVSVFEGTVDTARIADAIEHAAIIFRLM